MNQKEKDAAAFLEGFWQDNPEILKNSLLELGSSFLPKQAAAVVKRSLPLAQAGTAALAKAAPLVAKMTPKQAVVPTGQEKTANKPYLGKGQTELILAQKPQKNGWDWSLAKDGTYYGKENQFGLPAMKEANEKREQTNRNSMRALFGKSWQDLRSSFGKLPQDLQAGWQDFTEGVDKLPQDLQAGWQDFQEDFTNSKDTFQEIGAQLKTMPRAFYEAATSEEVKEAAIKTLQAMVIANSMGWRYPLIQYLPQTDDASFNQALQQVAGVTAAATPIIGPFSNFAVPPSDNPEMQKFQESLAVAQLPVDLLTFDASSLSRLEKGKVTLSDIRKWLGYFFKAQNLPQPQWDATIWDGKTTGDGD